MIDLSLTPSDVRSLHTELTNVTKDCLTARLILGAFLGRPLLWRRRCANVCARFCTILDREFARQDRLEGRRVRLSA